ncbi:MAG: CoA transferase, partial [Gammaproteobacteria bacterium]
MALPLEGVNVLDLTNVMAGPYCAMVLGDMGANVVKIESFPDGDASRRFDPKINDESYCFAVLNRNKKSLALDLRDDVTFHSGRQFTSRDVEFSIKTYADPLWTAQLRSTAAAVTSF